MKWTNDFCITARIVSVILVASTVRAFAPCWVGAPTKSISSLPPPLVHRPLAVVAPVRMAAAANDDADNDEKAKEEKQEQEVVPSLSNSMIPPPSTTTRQPLDPLVKSLTRMDAETANAPTVKVPLWGELILDKSLFVLVPVAAFAVLGFVFSAYVALHVTDDWLTELIPSSSTTTTVTNPSSSDCRGLCSQQEQDLEGLRKFMNQFAK